MSLGSLFGWLQPGRQIDFRQETTAIPALELCPWLAFSPAAVIARDNKLMVFSKRNSPLWLRSNRDRRDNNRYHENVTFHTRSVPAFEPITRDPLIGLILVISLAAVYGGFLEVQEHHFPRFAQTHGHRAELKHGCRVYETSAGRTQLLTQRGQKSSFHYE